MYMYMCKRGQNVNAATSAEGEVHPFRARRIRFKIHQRGVQWKQGVVNCMLL